MKNKILILSALFLILGLFSVHGFTGFYPTGTIYFNDSFNRGDSTSLGDADSGETWSETTGTGCDVEIKDGELWFEDTSAFESQASISYTPIDSGVAYLFYSIKLDSQERFKFMSLASASYNIRTLSQTDGKYDLLGAGEVFSYSVDTWYDLMFIMDVDNTNVSMFVDGVEEVINDDWEQGSQMDTLILNTYGTDTLNVYIDNLVISSSRGVVGEVIPPTPKITCSHNLTDYTNHTDQPLYFGLDCVAGVSATTDVWNISVYLNDTLNYTVEDVALNVSILTLNLSYGYEEVGYNINISVDHGYDNVNYSARAENIFIDSVDPELTIATTFNNNSFYYKFIDDIDLTITGTDSNLYAMNLTIFELNGDGSINTTKNNTFQDQINSTSYSLNFTGNRSLDFTVLNWSVGKYKILSEAWDSHTDNKVKPIYWDLSDPDVIKIEDIEISGDIKQDKTEFLLTEDRYKFKITWDEDALNHELFIRAEGELKFIPGSDWKGHFVHFESKRWVDFDGENIKSVVVENQGNNLYKLNIELFSESDEVEFESIGDLNYVYTEHFFNISESMYFNARDVFTNTTITNFTINVINASGLIQSKSTTNGVVAFNLTSGSYWTNFSSPTHANNESSNLTFSAGGNVTYWVFASNSLYIFIYDEQTDSLITQDVSVKIINYDNQSVEQNTSSGSLFYSGLSTGNYELRYNSDGYNTRSYYTTITSDSTQSIELFLLNTSHATYVSFVVEDESGNTIEGATLQGYRHFIDCNCFKVVEMDKSTFNGVGTLSLELYEARYRFIVLNDAGATIYSSTSDEGYKITTNAYTLTSTLLGDTTESFFGTSNLYQNLSWSNSTKQFYYTINDGSLLVDQFCLYVYQYDFNGENEICKNCVNATSGTAICNVSSYVSNGKELVARGWIHTNTEYSEYWTKVISVFSDMEAVATFGTLGVFLGFIIILTMFFAGLVLAGFGGAIIFFDIALIFVSILQLVKISFPVLLGVVVVSIIVMVLLGDKR